VRLLAACALLVSLATASCTDRGRLGEPFRLNGTEGGAGTFTWAYYTAIVASGDAVLAAWLNQNGALLRNAVTRRSVDGGKSWSEESVLNDGEYANTVSVTPRLTILPGERRVLAVWQSRRNEAGQKFVLARRSEDFGGTWQPPARLNERPQAFLPAVATNDDGVVVVAYDDERNINRDIYANRSLDEGRTWLAKDVRIDTLPRSESGAPAAAIGSDGYAYVVWEEHPRTMKERQMISPHLLAASSADRGVTWSEPHRVLPGEHETTPLWPALVESRGRLTLVWSEGLTGQASKGWLWLASSTDRGKTWSAPVAVYEGEVQPLYQIVARGEHLYLTWHGGEGKQRGGIYFNASDDGGGTWRQPWTEPLRLDRAGESAIAYHPRIAIHRDAEVAVTWQESNQRVLVSVSRDGGRTWPEPTIIAETANKETETLRYPQVAVTGDAAYVLWESWKERSPKKSIADIKKTSPRDVFVRRMTLS
jgi:Neuraminidase (sialidase)